MGIDTSFKRVPAKPSICLGACEISVFEMTGAYSTFANDGFYTKPVFITRIEDKNGNTIYQSAQEQTRVLSKGANYVMTKMLQHVAKGTPEFGSMKSAIGGKTGTTNYAADCWFMGITPKLVVGTWTGCDDRWVRFRDFTWGQGGKQARPIFAKLMKKLEADPLSGYVVVDSGFIRPAGQLEIEVDCGKYSGGSGLPSILLKDEEPKPKAPQGADPTPGDEFN
jgi:penicillin-binding protein 1A